MVKKDLDFIVSILKGDRILHDPNWYEVLGFLMCHRVAGLFYSRAKKQGIELPNKIENILRDIFEKQKIKNVLMRKQLAIIMEKIIETDTQCMLLKGSVLSNLSENEGFIYEDGERVSNDIDFLVDQHNIDTISRVLHSLGFKQGFYDYDKQDIQEFYREEIVKRRMTRGEIAPFIKKNDDKLVPFFEVDINFSLGNTPLENEDLLKGMLKSCKVFVGKVPMLVPNEELFFLHLIMHQYKENCLMFMVDRNKDLDLYKLADIYYLLQAKTLDLLDLENYIEKYHIEQEVGVVLRQVGQVFNDIDIQSYAKKFKCTLPKVVDYKNVKTYKWRSSFDRRIRLFNSKKFLEENYDVK